MYHDLWLIEGINQGAVFTSNLGHGTGAPPFIPATMFWSPMKRPQQHAFRSSSNWIQETDIP